jgi:hypothetical protein
MNSDERPISMAIDLKKYRLRVHKNTLRELGNPEYIQLMFHPEKKAIVILCTNELTSAGQEEKVCFDKPGNDGTFQMYSKTLILKIQKLYPELDHHYAYRLTGYLLPSLNAAYFPLSTISKITNIEAKINGPNNRPGIPKSDSTPDEI